MFRTTNLQVPKLASTKTSPSYWRYLPKPTNQPSSLHSYIQSTSAKVILVLSYSAAYSFWPLEGLAELADSPIGCGEVARGGCLFAWNFSVRSTVLTEAQRRTRPNTTLSLRKWLAPKPNVWNFHRPKTNALRYTDQLHHASNTIPPGISNVIRTRTKLKLQNGKQ